LDIPVMLPPKYGHTAALLVLGCKELKIMTNLPFFFSYFLFQFNPMGCVDQSFECGIASGTFWFDAITEDGSDTVRIREGRFDYDM
jgi:hypothetical protein